MSCKKRYHRRPLQTVCCVCNRRKIGADWGRSEAVESENLSHGYCPECFRKVMTRYGLDSEIAGPVAVGG